MRFALAIVAFIVAAGMVAFGIAQRTVFAPDDRQQATVQLDDSAPYTVIDGSVLNTFSGQQRLDALGDGTVFAAYGRTGDVQAWLAGQSYNSIGWNAEEQQLTSEVRVGEPLQLAADTTADGSTEAQTAPVSPVGSDLWLEETSAENQLTWTVNVPDDISIILASDGTAPGPGQIDVSWPVTNSTPFAGPLIIGGALFFLLGLVLLIWGFVHMRRTRGPRRKSSPRPKRPRPAFLGGPRGGTDPDDEPTYRRGGVRAMSGLALVGASALVLTGCSNVNVSEYFGDAPTPTPSASASAEAAAEITPVAVTPAQVERIVQEVSDVAAQADADRNADLIATRFAGPALQERQSNYQQRGADGGIAAPNAIPATPIQLDLPEATSTWPRRVLAVVGDNTAETAPTALVLIQQTPQSQYLVNYALKLQADTAFPAVAPSTVGAPVLNTDNRLLSVRPDQLGAAYADVLAQGQNSSSFDIFNEQPDQLRTSYGVDQKNKRKEELPKTASLEFSNGAGSGPVIAFASNESGAIVALDIVERETIKPVEAGATINLTGRIKALVGKESTSSGVESTYDYQLLFYVPPSTDDQTKVTLLGFNQNLISTKEL